MANIKSQKKRVLVSAEENKRNTAIRSKVKNAVKKYMALIDAKDVEAAEKLIPETVSIINKARSSGVYKDNTASRKIATLYKALNAIKA